MLKKILGGLVLGVGIVGGTVIAMEVIDKPETPPVVDTEETIEEDLPIIEMSAEEEKLYNELVDLLGEYVSRNDAHGLPVKKIQKVEINDNEVILELAANDNVKQNIHLEILEIIRNINFDKNLNITHTLQSENMNEVGVHWYKLKDTYFKNKMNWNYNGLDEVIRYSYYYGWSPDLIEDTEIKVSLDLSKFIEILEEEIIFRKYILKEEIPHEGQRFEITKRINGIIHNEIYNKGRKYVKVTTYIAEDYTRTIHYQFNENGTISSWAS